MRCCKSSTKKHKSYKCKKCTYTYNPSVGDPQHGIPADTPFEELPDTWKCPVCGAPKSEFEKL